MLNIFAGCQIDRSAARRADAVGTDAEDNRRAVDRFSDRDKRDQRMDLADPRIVFEADVKARMQAIDERRAHRSPVHLALDQPDAGGEFFGVIGRPPDSLAFAWSDRSGRDERSVFRLRFLRLCHLCRLGYFGK